MSIDTPSTDAETESDTTTPRTGSTTFINTSGGLLTDELVSKLRQRHCGESAVRPETFALPNTEPPEEADIEAEIGDTWDSLRERWDELTMDETLFHMDVSDARNKWILKLFQNLGFEPVFQRENLEAGGIEANLSHKGWPDGEIESYGEMEGRTAPILHTVEPEQKLDEKPEDAPRGAKSPHDTLQEFLNASDEHDWAVVTNGLTLRVLRDFYHTYTRGYVEFDLENMFTSRKYGDFRALYRLCHATRFIEPVVADEEEDDIEAPLEQLYQVALSTGVKVGQDLQSNVVSAIETLGTGLLNQEIREFLEKGGEEEAKEYYQEVLLLVYRLLFLMYAEQRGMMASRDSLYTDEYSITNLREKAETRRSGSDRNTDLWHGLQSTFRLVEKGDEELGVPCYNGMLFDSERLDWVSESECSNDDLLDAIEDLTLIEHEGTRQRISYADLGVEEIGSVYESLLEFTPRLATEVIELEDRTVSRGEFYLDDRGTERKETGSYYTDPGLVQELVQSALKPVVEDRLENATTTAEKEDALLSVSVCDPASGSGAFLIAANNFLAQRLARIRSESDYPPEDQVREARRDVLQHCIYAVDLNPMAVELAKVSLWINSAVEDKPLNFLDHHIKCGNSLIGTNSELLEGEFPADAYETSSGRDWHVGNEIRKRVRNENKERSKGSSESSLQQWGAGKEEYVDIAEQLDAIEEKDTEDIERKKQLYDELRQSEGFQQEKLAYDIWTAAFYWPMDGSVQEYPSPSTIEKIRRNPNPDDEALRDLINRATKIANQQRFFHWELEFPEIFGGSSAGFDCILGNPPWERVKFQEKEFFATRNKEIADASTKSKRQNLIQQLEDEDPELYQEYQEAVKASQNTSNFLRESRKYELTAKGDINYYPLFTGLGRDLINPRGRAGMVVPSGIATDYYTQDFFSDLVENKQLVSLYDFENSKGIFQEVHRSYKFSLITLTGRDLPSQEADFAFYLTEVQQLQDDDRHFSLTKEDLRQINPNTGSCPIFRSQSDAEVARRLYEGAPVLINENEDRNPWGVDISRLIDLNGDSELLATEEDLEEKNAELSANLNYIDGEDRWLRVYEGKMINLYNHRFASTYTVEGSQRSGRSTETEVSQLLDPEYLVNTRFWVEEGDVDDKNSNWNRDWYFSYMDVCAATNRRTMIAGIIPESAPSFSLRVLTDSSADAPYICCLLANYNSFSYDFAARQSVGGVHLSDHVVKQLPVIPPERYSDDILQFVVPRVLELSYTAWDLAPFADDVWSEANDGLRKAISEQWNSNSDLRDGNELREPEWVNHSDSTDNHFPHTPFIWDTERRDRIRAQLDALFARLYGLDEDDLAYLLDTFPVVKKEDKKEFGEYRTKKLVLENFHQLEDEFATIAEEENDV
jgi:hypothetical protein